MTDVSEQSVAEVTIPEVLNLAADLLEKPGAWLQGEMAENADGIEVLAKDPAAVCWCMVGALRRVAGIGQFREARPFIVSAIGAKGITTWNDARGRTQAEVVAALRSAALLAAPRAGEGVNRG